MWDKQNNSLVKSCWKILELMYWIVSGEKPAIVYANAGDATAFQS